MRQAVRIGAGLGLALGIVTCTDRSVTGPKHRANAALDFRALAAASVPGTPHIPVDSLEITFRRADGSVALDDRLGFKADTLAGDSAVIRIDLELSQSTETFTVVVRAFGAGLDWYHFAGTAQVAAGATAQPTLTGQYVGPGANAARVVMRPVDTTAVGGTVFPLRALAYGAAGDSITGVPIGYRVSDSTRARIAYLTSFSAQLTAALSLRDSVWVVAETPTHLKDSTRVRLVPQPAKLLVVSGNSQTGVVSNPLKSAFVVRVLDALGGGFKGDSVSWSVTTGQATLSAAVSVSDDTGYAQIAVTPLQVGALTVQATAKAITGPIAQSPASFTAIAGAGNVKKVVISPKTDTIAYGAPPVQYTATLYDSLNNVVSAAVLWTSTVPNVATVNSAGLATAASGDSTRIVAASGGYADTARLYIRILRTITLAPSDTVITAVGDSVRLRTTAADNFGAPVTSGLKIKYVSASAGVVSVDTTGKAKLLGPGNGVILAIDTVASAIVVQGSATLRVNQVPFGIVNNPKDSVIVGVNGQTPIVATAVDSNGFAIPGKTFSWVTRPPLVTGGPIASVTSAGLVTGVALGWTYAVDTLVQGLGVLRDSTKVVVSAAPPALLEWGFDSTTVGNGGSVSISLAVTTPPAAALTVTVTSTDSTIAKASPSSVVIPAGASATSVAVYGYKAGRAVLTAGAPGYTSKAMTMGVVSTITFREIASPCCQQQYFYLNQNETHRAQVWLSDPAPAGGLGITFVYGRGFAAVTPSPAVIPGGQLSADIVLHGVTPGTSGQADSVVPTSGGYAGKFSYVYVAPDSLRLTLPYPSNGVAGVGQLLQPYVAITYAMDHPLYVSAQGSSAVGSTPAVDTIRTGTTSQSLSVKANAPGVDTLTLAATGWVAARAVLTFSTPHLGVSGTLNLVAGTPSPNRGSWWVYPQDSLRYGHPVADTLRATLISRDTTIVAVDSATAKVLPGNSSATVSNALRAQPGAGGRSVWLVATAPPGYAADSFQMNVLPPTLTLALGYPGDGRVAVGTLFTNAGYVSIPYARTDTFWVVFGHTKQSVVAGPDSVAILKGQTLSYFNIRGDTLSGSDTMSVVRATGYVLPMSLVFHVDSLHVRPYTYPSGLYTISPPQNVSAYAYDPVDNQARPLVAPLRVALSSSSPNTFVFDSAAVTIAAGASVSNYDTLRVTGAVDTVGAYIRSSTIGSTASTPDSVGRIKVLPTPLTITLGGYPYTGYVGRGLKLQNSYVSIPAAAPNPVTVALQHTAPLKDSLSVPSLLIPKGSSQSPLFDIFGLDSTGTDSVTATATGFVSNRQTIRDTAAALSLAGIGASHVTTEPPLHVSFYTRTRVGTYQNVINAQTVALKSSDSTVIQIDSALAPVRGDSGLTTVPAGQETATFRVRFVGVGTARLRVSAPGFDSDSSVAISVTGPLLYFGYTTVTTGVGQVSQPEYVYVSNAVTGTPLVVTLQRSDSQSLSQNQIFGLSATVDTIPVGYTSTSSNFTLTGRNVGSALLIARAQGYTQAAATVAVGQPQLASFSGILSLYVGAPPTSVFVYTEDQTGAARSVASPITVAASSTAPTIAVPDSTTLVVPVGADGAYLGVQGLLKGSTAIVFSSPNYKSDTLQVSVDTAQLVLSWGVVLPAGTDSAQMYVQIPFNTASAVVVTLASSDTTRLKVPATVMIPPNTSYVYFYAKRGTNTGTVTVTATATGFRAATPVSVPVQ